jgi:hypothetical protein
VDGQQTVGIVLLSKAVVKINQKDTVRRLGRLLLGVNVSADVLLEDKIQQPVRVEIPGNNPR